MIRAMLIGGSVALVLACGRGDRDEPAATPVAGERPALTADVRRAAEVARAIDAAPEKADSILAAHELTVEQLDSLMYAIAADSAKTAAYESARRP